MKLFLMALLLTLFLACPSWSYSEEFLIPSWLKDQSLKWGLVASFSTAQSMTGLVESWKFNGRHVVSEDSYHIFRYGQDISWLATGWMLYGNIRADKPFITKLRRVLGSACLARNAYEWSYKANRWGNPFDYNPDHTNNQKAIVYFKFQNGHLVDAYIGSGPISGPLIDMGFLTCGLLLLK